jgi:hypothetical protein
MSTDASVYEFRGQIIQADAHGSYRAPVESEVGLDVKGSELTGRSWSHCKGARSRVPTFTHLDFLDLGFLAAMSYARGEADVIAGVNLPPRQKENHPHVKREDVELIVGCELPRADGSPLR